MSSKIEMTDEIITSLKAARTERRISASALSKALNRDASYISSLELKRLRTISIYDFIAILCIVYNISENEAIEKAEILSATKINISNLHLRDYGNAQSFFWNQPVQVNEYSSEKYPVDWNADIQAPELIKDTLDVITKKIIEFYENNPKDTVFILQNLKNSLQSSLDLSMEIIGMPIYTLKTLDEKSKKDALGSIMEIIKKYAGNI